MKITSSLTLVLGGGGVTGIAWLTGIINSLSGLGFDLEKVECLIGTSAGATVAAQISSGTPLEELYQKQVDELKQIREIRPEIKKLKLVSGAAPAIFALKRPEVFRRRIGRMAIKARTASSEDRFKVIRDRLPNHDWPSKKLILTAINAETGELECLDKKSGASLEQAVAASCAVPGVWPVVEIGQKKYYDGGLRSTDNADLAKGSEKVIIFSPIGQKGFSMPGSSLEKEIRFLEQHGSKVLLISPDRQSVDAAGKNPLDPDKRKDTAIAGARQGVEEFPGVKQFLS